MEKQASYGLFSSMSNTQLVEFFDELSDAYFTTQEYTEKPVCVICLIDLLLVAWVELERINVG